MASLKEQLNELTRNYTACDVSDALLKLQKVPPGEVARAGFLADLTPYSPSIGPNHSLERTAGPATTFQFGTKDESPPEIARENPEKHGFPPGRHWVDFTGDYAAANPTDVGFVVVIDQPQGQFCAVTGGIVATRMGVLGAKAAVVNGRVRDVREMQLRGFPVWARGTSTVGTGAEAKAVARDIPLNIGGVHVSPGDIVFCDPMNGVVVVSRDLLEPVLELLPKLGDMDNHAKQAVEQGMSVTKAFKMFRS
ncbi:hypothetical protein N7539_006211 [Penicillium diatomitis]|uniref:Uncharacterized protein n=1 Tax=Penicillium diatomitis TaxID=2819901 RepID=A0A9W9X347_9EURO|nr:uncharacterized protein N7539_006211 [Penicillium diatomitis]KAJ5482765.1 hypothetical protein N7539_006211 [Penicillium diatomitis]